MTKHRNRDQLKVCAKSNMSRSTVSVPRAKHEIHE